MAAKAAKWDEMAVVGRIARAHGLRGQVIVNLETDFPEERFQPGATLFALISILKQIPAEPMRFRILDQETLAYEARTAATRPCPRYAPAELNELLRGFRLDRSFLMRHGIQEYLFARLAD